MFDLAIYAGAFLGTMIAVYLLNMHVYGNKTSIYISISTIAVLTLYLVALFFFELPTSIKDHTLAFVFAFYGYTGGVTWARIVQKKNRKAQSL